MSLTETVIIPNEVTLLLEPESYTNIFKVGLQYEAGGESWLTDDQGRLLAKALLGRLDGSTEPSTPRLDALEARVAKLETAQTSPSSAAAEQTNVEVLFDAVAQMLTVEFEYKGAEDFYPETRRVAPSKLDTEAAHPYVEGEDEDAGDWRRFRLDRIEGKVVIV